MLDHSISISDRSGRVERSSSDNSSSYIKSPGERVGGAGKCRESGCGVLLIVCCVEFEV